MTTADDVDCRRCNAAGRLLKGWKAVTAVTVAKRRHTPMMTLDAFMVVWFGVGCIDLWLTYLWLGFRCSFAAEFKIYSYR